MSLESVSVKKELCDELPKHNEYTVVQNGSANKNPSADLQLEFVNIKMEVEEPDTNVEEEEELIELAFTPSSTLQPQLKTEVTCFPVTVKVEPGDQHDNGDMLEVSIEPKMPSLNEYQEHPYNFSIAALTKTSKKMPIEEQLNENSTRDGKFMCPICHKRFANKGNVQRHITLHSRVTLQCNVCSKQCVSQEQLEKHLKRHSNEKKHQCDQCSKKFRTLSNLESHKKMHLTEKPFICDSCDRSFTAKANLVKHQMKSRCKDPNVGPIVCNVCNKIFKKEFLLKSHLRRHTDEKPYTCDICKVSFKYKSTVIRHTQLHNGVKPFSCKICGKTFTHAGLIKPHMRIHTGEKPYQCPVCNKFFAHKHNMNRHTLRHNKIKRLTCEICQKKFPKESRLKYHMRTHTKEKPFMCYVCYKRFSHKQNVLRHYARKHPNDTYTDPATDASVSKNLEEIVADIQSSDAEEILP